MAITYTIDCQQDDYSEIEGSFASGDDKADIKMVKSIQHKHRANNVWAWFYVTVTAECQGFEGKSSCLGACSYKDEAGFKASDIYKELCEEALCDLREKLADATSAEREVYLALNPIVETAREFELDATRDRTGCVKLTFIFAHPLYGEQSILLQHDVDVERFLASLSSDDRESIASGWDITVAIKSF